MPEGGRYRLEDCGDLGWAFALNFREKGQALDQVIAIGREHSEADHSPDTKAKVAAELLNGLGLGLLLPYSSQGLA